MKKEKKINMNSCDFCGRLLDQFAVCLHCTTLVNPCLNLDAISCSECAVPDCQERSQDFDRDLIDAVDIDDATPEDFL